MFDIGWSELVVIGVVALIAIGPKELPGVLRMVGQWVGKARRMAAEFQGQFNEAMREYADPESVKLHDAAIEYQQHFKTSYEEAVFACIRIKRMAEAAPSPEAALADILNAFPT